MKGKLCEVCERELKEANKIMRKVAGIFFRDGCYWIDNDCEQLIQDKLRGDLKW